MSVQRDVKAVRAADREQRLAALRDGRRQRATTFTDRKKEGRRKAARGRSFR